MSSEELKELIFKRPFKPIRLLLTTGEWIDIRHPEMALLGRSYVAMPLEQKRGVDAQMVWHSLIHSVKAYPLPQGRTKRRRHTA
jgi:hypothetical protein